MGLDYYRYMASREWAEKREAVRERCGGYCERCGVNRFREVHHLTYERFGEELLTDLMGLCRECHEYVSAKSTYDPAKDVSFFVIAVNLSSWKRVIPDWYLVMAKQSGTRVVGNISKAQLPAIEAVNPACQAIIDSARQLGQERFIHWPASSEAAEANKTERETDTK